MSDLRGETERLLRWELERAVKRIVELEEVNQHLRDTVHELRERIEDISL
jgi:hypothetical protein